MWRREINKYVISLEAFNPFEILLLVVSVLSGLGGLLQQQDTSQIILQHIPTWELKVWYGGLIIGGVVSLFGALHPSVSSMLVERVGLTILFTISLLYSIILLTVGQTPLSLSVLLTVGFSFACFVRCLQISITIWRNW